MHRVQLSHGGQRRDSIDSTVAQSTSSNQSQRAWQQSLRHRTRPGPASLCKQQIVVARATSTDNEIIDRQDTSSNNEDEETDYVVVGSGIGGQL